MSLEAFNSVVVLLMTAVAGLLAARFVLSHLRATRALWLFIAVLWIVAIAGILVLDVNIPLAKSHYSPGGAPAPVSLAVLAMFFRFAALASIVLGQSRFRSAFTR